MKTPITNLDRSSLEELLVEKYSEKPFRAKQLFKWLYRERTSDFNLMTDIAKPLRAKLTEDFEAPRLVTKNVQESKDGTFKFLFELPDGALVETVLISNGKRGDATPRYTICLSSQVGCRIGCKFCRTALMGLVRHLETWEIIAQALSVLDFVASPPSWIKQPPKAFSNVVFMGMGEPLDNPESVTQAAKILTDELGFTLSYRRVTISTSGLVPKIKMLADEQIPSSLAVSLNATTDESRNKLIPINKKWSIKDLKDSMVYYCDTTGKHITVEYVMLKGVNDTEADLKRLPNIVHGFKNKVNLIPYNENAGLTGPDGLPLKAPTDKNISHWQRTLAKKGINCRIRWSKGEDIDAACGQLASQN